MKAAGVEPVKRGREAEADLPTTADEIAGRGTDELQPGTAAPPVCFGKVLDGERIVGTLLNGSPRVEEPLEVAPLGLGPVAVRPGHTAEHVGEGESRVWLTRFAPARLVEDELTDLDRLGVIRGPTWRHISLMEIQRATRSID